MANEGRGKGQDKRARPDDTDQQGHKGKNENDGESSIVFTMPGRDQPETFKNPGALWQRVREERGQNPDEFADEQGYGSADELISAAREAQNDDGPKGQT